MIEVDMTGIVNLRKKWKPEYQPRYGVNLTYVPFIARATIDAIGRWPWVNAEVKGETALIKKYVNLGMAVAVDDAKGLMVPVIHRGRGEEPGRPVPRRCSSSPTRRARRRCRPTR